jgi:SagB-type dehydrogenase family enzyme
VEGLDEGLYHYDIRRNGLVTLALGDHGKFVRDHILTHPDRPGFASRVVFVLSSVFERSMYRYRESRSYRVVHYDLGHLLQTTALLASAVGRPSFRGYSFHDRHVDGLLGIDGIHEASMAFAAIG